MPSARENRSSPRARRLYNFSPGSPRYSIKVDRAIDKVIHTRTSEISSLPINSDTCGRCERGETGKRRRKERTRKKSYTHTRATLEKLALFRSRPGAIKCAACVEGHRYKNSQHRALSLGARGKTAAEKLLQTRGVETREKSRGVIPYVGRNFRRYFHFSTPTLISPGFVATTPCEEASPTSLFFFFFFPR